MFIEWKQNIEKVGDRLRALSEKLRSAFTYSDNNPYLNENEKLWMNVIGHDESGRRTVLAAASMRRSREGVIPTIGKAADLRRFSLDDFSSTPDRN
jgi:hypothetical protein